MPTPRRYPNSAARQAAYRERLALARRQELAAKGLPELPAVPAIPGTVRWRALLVQAERCLQAVQTEMVEYCQQRSGAWQESERGEAFADRLEALRELHEALAELVDGEVTPPRTETRA